MRELLKLMNNLSGPKRSEFEMSTHENRGGFFDYSDNNDYITSRQQQCVAKMNFSTNYTSYLDFLNKYMTQVNKEDVTEKPELFGNMSKDEFEVMVKKNHKDVLDFNKAQKKKLKRMNSKKLKQKQDLFFKWIISPDIQMSKRELQLMTEYLVGRIERYQALRINRKDFKLNWQAAVHMDTEHPHVHLLLDGKDQKGELYRFDRNFIKLYLKDWSQEYLTQAFGKRTEEQLRIARDRSITSDRYTGFDKEIFTLLDENNSIAIPGNEELKKRLEYLKEIRLAQFQSGRFILKENWNETLQAVGRYNKFMEAKRYLRSETEHELNLYNTEDGKISGRIVKIYTMNDEDVWNNACVIENEVTGKAWYVPLFKELDYEKYFNKTVSCEMKQSSQGRINPVVKVIDNENITANRESDVINEVYDLFGTKSMDD